MTKKLISRSIQKQLALEEHTRDYELFITLIYVRALNNIVDTLDEAMTDYYRSEKGGNIMSFDSVNKFYQQQPSKILVDRLNDHFKRIGSEKTIYKVVDNKELISMVVDVEMIRAKEDEQFLHETAYRDIGFKNRSMLLFALSTALGVNLVSKSMNEHDFQSLFDFTTDSDKFKSDYKRSIERNNAVLQQRIMKHLEAENMANKLKEDVFEEIKNERRFVGYRNRRLLPNEINARRTFDDLKVGSELGMFHYRNVATLDHKTSDICRYKMDGTVYSYSEYEIGETAPPFHVNCRTVVVLDMRDNTSSRYVIDLRDLGYTMPLKTTTDYTEWLEVEQNYPINKITRKVINQYKQELNDRVRAK